MDDSVGAVCLNDDGLEKGAVPGRPQDEKPGLVVVLLGNDAEGVLPGVEDLGVLDAVLASTVLDIRMSTSP